MSGEGPRAPSFIGVSVRGASHVRADRPCQDAVFDGTRGGARAVAVADGHGSSLRSDTGARMAVEVAVEHLLGLHEAMTPEERGRLSATLEFLRAPTLRQIVQAWVDQVEMHNAADPAPAGLRDYGTTLLFALATPSLLLFGQLGDGDILVVDADGQVSRPIPPDPLAFANETPSMCEADAWTRIRLAVRPAPTGESLVLLCTDGYANSYADDEVFERIGPDYLKLVRSQGLAGLAPHLPRFLDHVSAQGSGDDVSVALLYFPPSTGDDP